MSLENLIVFGFVGISLAALIWVRLKSNRKMQQDGGQERQERS